MLPPPSTAPRKLGGFTLIELSIVLVIIGLLVGGVLVGRELIVSAKIRKGISDLEKLGTAVQTFKLKYNCIPGDCPNITEVFPTGIYAGNGNGNGLIDNWSNESMSAHDSLVASNLIPKTSVILHPMQAQGSYLSCYNDSYGYLYFADLYSIALDGGWTFGDPSTLPNATKRGTTFSCANWDNSGAINEPSISPNEAMRIDTKLDDGLPETGKFFGQAENNRCTVAGQNLYLDSNTVGCRFIYYLP